MSHANRAAEALLRADDGLTVRREPGGGPGGRLSAALPAKAGQLARVVADAAGRRLGVRLRVSRPSGGAGVPGVAAALGVWPETVRAHLARCVDATGARNQAALAAFVARLPRSDEDPPRAGP